MKILVISRSVWNTNNSFGNTYDNLFKSIPSVEIAHVFLCDGVPEFSHPYLKAFFQIPESEVLDSFLNHSNKKIGGLVDYNTVRNGNKEYEAKFKYGQKKRLNIFYMARDYFWAKAPIDYDGLFSFVDSFKPDLIFMPLYYANYVSKMALRIITRRRIKLILQTSIDVYSLRQLSFSPFFWIRRLVIRSTIRSICSYASLVYTISEKQRKDYEKYLRLPCKVLYKFFDKNRKIESCERKKGFFLYAGNIGDGRWKVLSEIGRIISEEGLGLVHVFTMNEYTNRMKRKMKNCVLHPPVSANEVVKLQNEAEFLLHVESFNIRNRCNVRYSISTKIMDYVSISGNILAVGPKKIASMDFIQNNGLGFVFNSIKEFQKGLIKLNNQELTNIHLSNCRRYVESQSLENSRYSFYSDLKRVSSSEDANE